MRILGIDPGKEGAMVLLDGNKDFYYELLPLNAVRELDFLKLQKLLSGWKAVHVYLERAIPMAMGAKSAFEYGRDFAKLELALQTSKLPTTYVHPSAWSRVMTEGVSKDLTTKMRSRVAAERLFPEFFSRIPVNKKGVPHSGVLEALLIAGYGMNQAGRKSNE